MGRKKSVDDRPQGIDTLRIKEDPSMICARTGAPDGTSYSEIRS